ncbi:MAG: type II toxin-antitoxin system HicA family toxin [Anaerolineae bacterium]|nr:type II toxin-antitoxin system HicA family toxin [Anaerolineae bacterium]
MKKRKLLKRILAGSRNIRFDEFHSLLESCGFVLKRISGSHHVYKHPDVPDLLSLQPDANGQTKLYQIRQFLKLVEAYNLAIDDDEVDDLETSEEGGE